MIREGPKLTSYCIDTLYNGIEKIASMYAIKSNLGDAAIFDTGTPRSFNLIKKELERIGVTPDNLTKIIISHVHLDHCGNTALFAQNYPKAKIYVHPRGSIHIENPTKLLNQSRKLIPEYYKEHFDSLNPIDPERIIKAEEGMEVPFEGGGILKLIKTPGHCFHHICAIDTEGGIAYTGDAFGSVFEDIAPNDVFASISPPAFNPMLMKQSVQKIVDTGVSTAALAHFGFHKDAASLARATTEYVTRVQEIAAEADDAATAVINDFTEVFGAKLDAHWARFRHSIHVNAVGVEQYARFIHASQPKERYSAQRYYQ